MTTTMRDWIRPWYPDGRIGHAYADCPELLASVPEPTEGSGWLDPSIGDGQRMPVCSSCLYRHNPQAEIEAFDDDEDE